MKCFLSSVCLMLFLLSMQTADFKSRQKQNSRVKNAYLAKEKGLLQLLADKKIEVQKLNIFLRIFKSEKIIEIWAKNSADKNYLQLTQFDICTTSGSLGPKRREGDGQMPEGFYKINDFNPLSNFHLSLGVSYPNESDRILGYKKALGGAIYIHGNCVTIGCFPITDDKIEELYILAVESKNNGEQNIPVHIFPCRFTDINVKALKRQYESDKTMLAFWENLKTGYDYFEKNKSLPAISVDAKGNYVFK
jgi:murein L,D-transpeptidase YafK